MQLIAYISMFIDHASKFAMKSMSYNPILGRLALPIFAYLIAMGMQRTSNKPKYIFRLFIFAIISQIPFILMIYGMPNLEFKISNILQIVNHFTKNFNIGFTFLIAALSIYFIDKNKKNFLNIFIITIISLFVVSELKTDYAAFGLLVVYLFYYIKNKIAISVIYLFLTTLQVFTNVLTPSMAVNLPLIERLKMYFSLVSLPIIFWMKENKKRDNKLIRILKYGTYPVHMLVIYFISNIGL